MGPSCVFGLDFGSGALCFLGPSTAKWSITALLASTKGPADKVSLNPSWPHPHGQCPILLTRVIPLFMEYGAYWALLCVLDRSFGFGGPLSSLYTPGRNPAIKAPPRLRNAKRS